MTKRTKWLVAVIAVLVAVAATWLTHSSIAVILLIATFAGVVATGILIVGYVFNWLL